MTLVSATPSPPTAIDLFAGAGGLTLGLQAAGLRVETGADNWRPAVRTYSANFDHACAPADLGAGSVQDAIEAIGVDRPLDVVAGGPPCQGFSIQRIGADEDHRNDLVLRFAEIAVALEPRVIVMENVPGLLGKRGTGTARRYARTLEAAGYGVKAVRVNAADFGTPQIRRRVVFLAWRDHATPPPVLQPTHPVRDYVTVDEAIGDLPIPPKDLTPSPEDLLHRRTRMSELNKRRLALIPPGGGFEHLPTELRVECHRDGPAKIGHRNVYGRLAPDEPAVTITARFDSFTRGKFAHPFEDRNISLREGARLQGFPDGHTFLGTQEEIAALIGNAVPPRLGEAIGRAVVHHLRGHAAEEPHGQLHLAAVSHG